MTSHRPRRAWRRFAVAALATAALPTAALAPPPAEARPAPTHAGASARTGTIEGVVTTAERPQRRVVNRYVGSGDAAARTLQEVPVIAYIEGAVQAAPAQPPGALEISQVDTTFAPPVRVVPVGTTVAFPNEDPFFHNVFSFSPAKRFDLGRYPQGESKSVLFDQPGAVKIYCEVHDYMRSAVIVVENPFHAVVGEDGRFTISGVPPGSYRLVIWHVELRPQELDVTVTEGGVARVEATLS